MKTDVTTFDMNGLQNSLDMVQPMFANIKLGENLELTEKRALIAKERRISQTAISGQRRKLSRTTVANAAETALAAQTIDAVPPRQVLQFLVRMGSFTSAPVKASGDIQDQDVEFTGVRSCGDLLARCQQETAHLPPPIQRQYRNYPIQHTPINNPDPNTEREKNIRLLQWNHLSQTLGTENDNFVCCPREALNWTSRRWRLLEEMIRYQPDIICLQEVDHFHFLNRGLGSIGYEGKFIPKPDSPCIYLKDNNGPDGCAIFVKKDKFKIKSESHRILEVWSVKSNQVAVCLELEDVTTGHELVVATTHLKARSGALLSTMRNEQGKDLLDWLAATAGDRPLLLSGDFNAPQSEPIYSSVCQHGLGLASAYRFEDLTASSEGNSEEVEEPYTTWKIRETGEQKYILDYIFHSQNGLHPVGVLEMPRASEVGEERFPNFAFPSDHLSLIADFRYIQ